MISKQLHNVAVTHKAGSMPQIFDYPMSGPTAPHTASMGSMKTKSRLEKRGNVQTAQATSGRVSPLSAIQHSSTPSFRESQSAATPQMNHAPPSWHLARQRVGSALAG